MVLKSHWLPDKSEVIADRGMVVAKHPLAADAGIEILAEGGNAIDAAVATGFALTVVKPTMVCLGGVGYMLAHDAGRREQWCFDGSPRAPLSARPDIYQVEGETTAGIALYRVKDDENSYGHRAVAVPGLVAALCTAHARLGRLPLGRVLEPAIRLAANGWAVDWGTTAYVANWMWLLRQNAAAAAQYLPDGMPPSWGPAPSPVTVLRQPDLAETLRRIARDGADGFYLGETAALIADDMREHGGWITRDDLAAYPRRADAPVRRPYRGVEALIPPVACGGTTALETLRILEQFDVSGAGHNTVAGLHLFVEAARRAFADRFHYLGDPEVVPVPIDGLLSDGHARALAALIARERTTTAAEAGASQPWVRFAGERPEGDPWAFDPGARPAALAGVGTGDDATCTTHLAVVDADRNAVTATITAGGGFGAGVVAKGTGVLFNNGMTWFNPVPGAANSIAPGKRALTNMSPMLLLRDGEAFVAMGAPGGRKIINAISQLALNVVDHRLTMQQALTAPRVDASGNEVLVDVRIDPGVVRGLEELGHRVTVVEDNPLSGNFSTPVAIMVDPESRRLRSGLTPADISDARGL